MIDSVDYDISEEESAKRFKMQEKISRIQNRLKFRFWDWGEKRFREGIEYGVDEEGNAFNRVLGGYYIDVIPLESTGLKDKNGKEIYEGDIVEFSYTADGIIFRGEVLWLDDRASFGISIKNSFQTMEDLMGYMKFVIVIGNIFENEELLEETPL